MIHRLGKILYTRGAKKGLADALGKPPSVISDLCSGKDRINDDLIEEISRALGIPPWHLFVDPETIYPYEHQKIVKAYLSLPKGMREAVDMIMFPEQNFPSKQQQAEQPHISG